MPSPIETVIVGAGQAGLALSRCLMDRDRPHVVLERGRVAERWRSERWDSFRLLTPNWHTRLPGHRYTGDDPDGFMPRDEVVAMFESYAASFDAPVQDATSVHRVEPDGDRWRVETDRGEVAATNVVVATGPHGHPCLPQIAAELPPELTQIHSSAYRNPASLPPGGVLVVGAGPTGQQLASELVRSGRDVHLAVGRHARLPRTYRGHDAFWWLERTGASEDVVDPRRGQPRPPHPVLSADRELGLDTLVAEGVRPVGRLLRVDGARLAFAADLAANYLDAEASYGRFLDTVDIWIEATGMPATPAPGRPTPKLPAWAAGAPDHLDVTEAGVSAVVWATGFRRELSWLPAAVLDPRGEPIHRRGVTSMDGLFFLGLSWLHRRASASIDGVGADARHLAEVIAHRTAATVAA